MMHHSGPLCPQLQALAMHQARSLCLTALTSLTCAYWEPRDLSSFQCSQLAHLHVLMGAHFDLLPSTLISLSLDSMLPVLVMVNLQGQHLRSQLSLLRICLNSRLVNLSDIRNLCQPVTLFQPLWRLLSSTFTHKSIPPDMDGIMTGQHFHHLGAWCPHLQRLHIHLQGRQQADEVLKSAARLT